MRRARGADVHRAPRAQPDVKAVVRRRQRFYRQLQAIVGGRNLEFEIVQQRRHQGERHQFHQAHRRAGAMPNPEGMERGAPVFVARREAALMIKLLRPAKRTFRKTHRHLREHGCVAAADCFARKDKILIHVEGQPLRHGMETQRLMVNRAQLRHLPHVARIVQALREGLIHLRDQRLHQLGMLQNFVKHERHQPAHVGRASRESIHRIANRFVVGERLPGAVGHAQKRIHQGRRTLARSGAWCGARPPGPTSVSAPGVAPLDTTAPCRERTARRARRCSCCIPSRAGNRGNVPLTSGRTSPGNIARRRAASESASPPGSRPPARSPSPRAPRR